MRLIPARLWALAVLSGLLQLIPFPIAGPTPLWRTAFCWVALLPLLAALIGNNRQGKPLTVFQGTLLGYLCGFLWYLGNCYWIYQTMHLFGGLSKPIAAGILILFSLYLGLYHAIFAALMTALRRSRFGVQGALLLSPFLWISVELARARITGLPWDLLGYAQIDNPLLTRLAPITGVYGISFIIAAVNALWLVRIRLKERRHTRTLLTIAGVALVLLYLVALRNFQPPARVPTTAIATLVQHNLSVGVEGDVHESAQEMYNSFTRYSLFPPGMRCNGIPELAGTRCADPAAQRPGYANGGIVLQPTNLVIWPESPSNFEERDPAFIDAISSLARAAHAPVIAGNIGIVAEPSTETRLLALQLAPPLSPRTAPSSGRYDKMHLVPFGEYVPYKKTLLLRRESPGRCWPLRTRHAAQRPHYRRTSLRHLHLLRVHLRRRDPPVRRRRRRRPRQHRQRRLVRRHRRPLAAPQHGPHARHRKPPLGPARHQHRSHRRH